MVSRLKNKVMARNHGPLFFKPHTLLITWRNDGKLENKLLSSLIHCCDDRDVEINFPLAYGFQKLLKLNILIFSNNFILNDSITGT